MEGKCRRGCEKKGEFVFLVCEISEKKLNWFCVLDRAIRSAVWIDLQHWCEECRPFFRGHFVESVFPPHVVQGPIFPGQGEAGREKVVEPRGCLVVARRTAVA